MRLSDAQAKTIKRICQELLGPNGYEVYLYGSRVQDDLKGGDIDLFVLNDEWPQDEEKKVIQILARLKLAPEIGDRKINLSLVTREELRSDPFWSTIRRHLRL